MKAKKSLVLVCLIMILVTIILIKIKSQNKHIDQTFCGYIVSLYDDTISKKINIHIEGKIEFNIFSVKQFTGKISIDGYEVTFKNNYQAIINFSDGCGHLDYFIFNDKEFGAEHLGYLCTKDFESILILLYDENSVYPSKYHTFISAPAETIEQAYDVAKLLSRDTWMDDIHWNDTGQGDGSSVLTLTDSPQPPTE